MAKSKRVARAARSLKQSRPAFTAKQQRQITTFAVLLQHRKMQTMWNNRKKIHNGTNFCF